MPEGAVSYAPVTQAGGDTFGGGLVAAAALKSGGDWSAKANGYGPDYYPALCDLLTQQGEIKERVSEAECDIRHDIKASEANVRKEVTDVRFQVAETGSQIKDRISDLERNMDNQFCKTNDIVKSEGSAGRETTMRESSLTREKMFEQFLRAGDKEEARFLRTWDGQQRLEDKIEKEGERTRTQLHAFEKNVDDRFCKENERELQSKIDELRAKVQCCECPPTSATEVADVVIQRLVNLNILGGQGNGLRA